MKKRIMLVLCVVLLATLIAGAVLMANRRESIENAGASPNAAAKPKFLTYQGKDYPIKQHLTTVLLIGTDSTEGYEEQTEGLLNFVNDSQADFLMLAVLDTDAGTAEILQVNRDTMTDVPWLDVLGNYGGTEFKQLCLAFNYGDGGPKSCRNTVSAVSSLLFDAPIDYYMQVPMTAIPVLNDVVGGVPITFQEDMTDIDPAFVKGATVRLDGSQAEKFVRSRMGLSDDTNTYRMERQRQYLDSFQNCAREAIDTDSQFVLTLLEKLSDYLQTNLTGDQLVNFITQLDESEISPIRPPQGALTLEDGHYAFYVDLDPTWEDVKRAYCG